MDVKRPDEKIVLTYISLLFKGCAEFLHNQVLCKAIKKVCACCRRCVLGRASSAVGGPQALDITRRHDEWIESYDTLAAELLEWVLGSSARYGNRSHGRTSAAIKEVLDAFYGYKSTDKPGWLWHCC